MMDRDSKTRSGARAPGVGQQVCSHGGAQAQQLPRHRAGMYRLESGEHEGRMQTRRGRDNWAPRTGQAPFDKPALKPYWGKPTVRNFRGDDGNVGIIRSPVRAIALPDNRHEAEEEEALQERSSEPLGLESCAATVRDAVKRR